ncbi:coiled-coil domain-containing protein 141 isoform 2-T2 [Anomaloglossus baeobatrachus]|uniref:coiled-coil domain-containing protein 141 isoform X2 n=1 Tax=Anomaloglossus baeobatrachus TaxID=238106 RepID=UPI003F508122
MSGDGNPTGQLSTTTVSSVAIQAGDSRIVIAILKSGDLVQLQLAEAVPNLFEIGENQDEAKTLLQDHSALLYKIKSLEDQVWDLLCEADKTAEENKDQSQVYDAMALTLKEAWDALILVLEKRRDLLQMTAEFFDFAQQFSDAIDHVETLLQDKLDTDDSITKNLQQLQQFTKTLLARSLALLNKSQELTEFIQQLKSHQPVANPDTMKGAHSSCSKVEGLLESLQDRRRQLDKQMRQHRRRLEQVSHVTQWHQQEEKVSCWLRNQRDLYLTDVQLGASLTENEELIHKHKQLVHDSQEWTSVFQKLKSEADGLAALNDCTDVEKLNSAYEKLNALHDEYWTLMDRRQALLLEANDFFNCVNKAFDKLGSMESYLKHLKMQNISEIELPAMQKEAEDEIQRCTSEAFHQGQTLLQKSPFSPGMTGIQEMIGYLQKRVDQLLSQSPASMENSFKQQEIMASLEDHLKKVSSWIHKINSDLESHGNPDSISECEDVRYKLGELAKQTKEASRFMESIAQVIREVMQIAPSGGEVISTQSQVLDEELKVLDQSIDEKLEVVNVYIAFIKSSEELDSHIQLLKEVYTPKSDEGTVATLEIADTQIQGVLDELFSVQDMGQNCLNVIKVMNKNTILKDKHVQKVEKTMAKLNKDKAEITNLWSTWRQHVNQINSSKHQWRTIKDQLRLANNRLQELEQDLQPLSSLILENDTQNLVNAQENLDNIKAKFQKLNDEMEQAVKISELLTREETQMNVKTGKIHDLAQYQQRLKDTIMEYEDFFIKIVAFYRMKAELSILKTEMEQSKRTCALYENQPATKQEQQTHIQSLYKIVLNLGTQIISTAQHSKYITISLHDLQHQIDDLERDSATWSSNVKNQEENVSGNVPSISIEEVNELKESFKDLKKKFNNLKFNYTKKADKGRNLKVIKNQIQQVEMYTEKIQALKKKIDHLERKLLESHVSQQMNKADIIQESISDLQKQINEFCVVMKDYKVYLEMAEDLQHIMEESLFWCEEACSTVVRVGRYSAECKTKESVEVLLKQFNKFVEPTVPQQEERIQQMTNIAKHIYGPEDGIKYVEKTLLKHKEALISVNDLCIYLKELEDKLQEPQKVPEISIINETGETIDLPVTPKDGSIQVDTDMQPELLADEAVSGDEYECISPDDISLPPLAETPESNLPQSETEQDEQPCYSSHSMHVSSYSMQMHINTSGKRVMDSSDFLTPVAYTDTSSHRKEKTSSYTERFYSPTAGYKAESPFSHHSTIVNETRYSLSSSPAKSKPNYHLLNEVHESHLQRSSVYESTEKTEQLHASDNTARTKDRAHATPDEFSGLMFQLDPAKSCQRHMGTQEAIRSVSEKQNNVSLAGQSPAFSKHLQNVTVKEGSPVTLEVEVSGYPEPTLTWYRKNEKHPTGDHLVDHEKQSLIIQEGSAKDSGQLKTRKPVYKATITPISDAKLTESRLPWVADIDWITLCVIYICVSIMYWLYYDVSFAQRDNDFRGI